MSRRGKRETLTPELTPLIDVVFLLLIFFMVSSVFKKQELSLDLKLPETQSGKASGKKVEAITIELTGETIAFQGQSVKVEELDQKLESLDKKNLMNLRVDGKVQYNRLVKILELLQKHKLNNLSLITDKK